MFNTPPIISLPKNCTPLPGHSSSLHHHPNPPRHTMSHPHSWKSNWEILPSTPPPHHHKTSPLHHPKYSAENYSTLNSFTSHLDRFLRLFSSSFPLKSPRRILPIFSPSQCHHWIDHESTSFGFRFLNTIRFHEEKSFLSCRRKIWIPSRPSACAIIHHSTSSTLQSPFSVLLAYFFHARADDA